MSSPLFIDTSALYAIYSPTEQRHAEASRIYSDARSGRRLLFSSTDVFGELVALVCSRLGADAAVRIGDGLRREDPVRLVRIDDEIRDRAWTIFKERRLPRLSLVDCTSSAVMAAYRIREVFTFDADFRRLGHRTLPAPRPLLKPRPQPRGTRRS